MHRPSGFRIQQMVIAHAVEDETALIGSRRDHRGIPDRDDGGQRRFIGRIADPDPPIRAAIASDSGNVAPRSIRALSTPFSVR